MTKTKILKLLVALVLSVQLHTSCLANSDFKIEGFILNEPTYKVKAKTWNQTLSIRLLYAGNVNAFSPNYSAFPENLGVYTYEMPSDSDPFIPANYRIRKTPKYFESSLEYVEKTFLSINIPRKFSEPRTANLAKFYLVELSTDENFSDSCFRTIEYPLYVNWENKVLGEYARLVIEGNYRYLRFYAPDYVDGLYIFELVGPNQTEYNLTLDIQQIGL